jgi:hypothetical protein
MMLRYRIVLVNGCSRAKRFLRLTTRAGSPDTIKLCKFIIAKTGNTNNVSHQMK